MLKNRLSPLENEDGTELGNTFVIGSVSKSVLQVDKKQGLLYLNNFYCRTMRATMDDMDDIDKQIIIPFWRLYKLVKASISIKLNLLNQFQLSKSKEDYN